MDYSVFYLVIIFTRFNARSPITHSEKGNPAQTKREWEAMGMRAVQDSRSGGTRSQRVLEQMLDCDGIHCQIHHLTFVTWILLEIVSNFVQQTPQRAKQTRKRRIHHKKYPHLDIYAKILTMNFEGFKQAKSPERLQAQTEIFGGKDELPRPEGTRYR